MVSTSLHELCQDEAVCASQLCAAIAGGADVGAADVDGDVPLHLLCRNAAVSAPLLEVLLQHCVEDGSLAADVTDSDGDTALLHLCRNPGVSASAITTLVAAGASANARTRGAVGLTPLMLLCKNAAVAPTVVSALLGAGADAAATTRDGSGTTALRVLVGYNGARCSAALVAALSRAGADIAATLVWAQAQGDSSVRSCNDRGGGGSSGGRRGPGVVGPRVLALLRASPLPPPPPSLPCAATAVRLLPRPALLTLLSVAAALLIAQYRGSSSSTSSSSSSSGAKEVALGGSNPYKLLGVGRGAQQPALTRAYRKLARRWHPDRNVGKGRVQAERATAAFAKIANAYAVLSDAEQREVYDRLGEDGLRRLIDGDPRVKKGWLPDDEILRRHVGAHDGPQNTLDWAVTSAFAWLERKLMER